jgi:hypothetical protein
LTVATKLDALDEPERLERLEAHVRALDLPFYQVSAVTGDGLPALLEADVAGHRGRTYSRRSRDGGAG